MSIEKRSASIAFALFSGVFVSSGVAVQAAPDNFLVTVSKNGSGTGSVASNAGAIDCGATCSDIYADSASITLTATPAAGSQFTGWLGPCSGTGACQFVVSRPGQMHAPGVVRSGELDSRRRSRYSFILDDG